MSEYLLVSDRCTCEDYPCCGHSRGGETYPMERSMALSLAKRGKVNICGEYRVHTYMDVDCPPDYDEDWE